MYERSPKDVSSYRDKTYGLTAERPYVFRRKLVYVKTGVRKVAGEIS